MPLTPSQIEDYRAQIYALKRRLDCCSAEVLLAKETAIKAQSDPSKIPLFHAKLARAKENRDIYIDAWDRLVLIHFKLDKPDDFPSPDEMTQRDETFENFDLLKSVEFILARPPSQGSSAQPPISNTTVVHDTSFSSRVLMDKLRLPHFSGDVKNWVSFRDIFTTLVHNDPSLSSVAKLHLLISSLSGEALSIVNKFEIIETNYSLAWESLTNTYDNERVLATTFVDQILSFRLPSQPNLQDFQLFLSTVADNLSAFRALKLQDAEDKLLAIIVLKTLDQNTRHNFELSQVNKGFPSVDSVVDFVRNKCQALKLSGQTSFPQQSRSNRSTFTKQPSRSSNKYNSKSFASTSPQDRSRSSQDTRNSPQNKEQSSGQNTSFRCSFCKEPHILSRCPLFLALSPQERFDFVSKWNGCRNCLNPAHKVSDCTSKWTCHFCKKNHHTLLHLTKASKPQVSNSDSSGPVCGHIGNSSPSQDSAVILGTARAIVRDFRGRLHHVRLFLDCGSQRSFITKRCAERIQTKIHQSSSPVMGLGGTQVASIIGIASFPLNSLYSNSNLKITASVLQNISPPLPSQPLPEHIVRKFRHLQLADPHFDQPQEVDILLGADYYDQVVTGMFSRSDPDLPATLPTIFGLVITGPCKSSNFFNYFSFYIPPADELNKFQLQSFWELEEPPPANRSSPDDLKCEEHFIRTHSRDPTGRYIVRLPFSSDPKFLGSNRDIAYRRFLSLEHRLSSNKTLREDYLHFMTEYADLGHMSIASEPSRYIIPHFGVMQNKLRVVFDASCGSTSLNQILLPGPKLQSDIAQVLLQFRLYRVAICTDLVKMYRQILLHPSDRKYQHIFWRNHPSEKLTEYELNTVTYGETPSAFLAIRTIHQLINDEGDSFPLAKERLLRGMYVDDIVSGGESIDEANQLCLELINLFAKGGFTLSKWASSHPSALPSSCTSTTSPMSLQSEDNPGIKVLGLVWSPQDDSFSYSVQEYSSPVHTKRTTLSFIARMYDPLGFLAPVLFRAKLYLQEMWKNNLAWDSELPDYLRDKWISFTSDWKHLSHIRIPRHIPSKHSSCNLVGFSDASTQGYAAMVFLHVQHSPDSAEAYLLMAKTKVAPIKFVSVARLELCAALLLARLLSSIALSPRIHPDGTYLFSDSQVALAWIHTPTHNLRVFEANRVAAIHDLVPKAEWRFVGTADNPADVASRGLPPSEMKSSKIWWKGPTWLSLPIHLWPQCSLATVNSTEEAESCSFTSSFASIDISWIERFSRYKLLIRTVAWMLRFARRSPHPFQRFSEPLTPSELDRAISICSRSTQQLFYPKGTSSPELAALSPVIDAVGVLRVGGRLQHSPLDFSARHPIIIPKGSHLARLIVRDIHLSYFHAGPSLTLAILRSKFWIPSALRLIKGQLSKCIPCYRRRPSSTPPLMAPLPASRFNVGRAFLQTGIDYAGPFTLRSHTGRKPALTKGYLCLFVCLSTKAIHLEAVSALSTEAFLACLDRFIARRGKPVALHSDNATNFVGASRYLKDFFVFLQKQDAVIADHLSSAGIEWHFIPPRSPHFGGIWEAGIKSVKTLLLSSSNSSSFTYEEFATMLARIESILNSRPLCPLSDDPTSMEALTPAHFLIGTTPVFLPEDLLTDTPVNRLSRWQLVQMQVQQLWSRWHLEYLNTLQQRHKWRKSTPGLQVNDLVVLIDKRSPAGHWPLARIIETHPGSDGHTRVVTIQTSTGSTFKRSTHQMARLPLPSESS